MTHFLCLFACQCALGPLDFFILTNEKLVNRVNYRTQNLWCKFAPGHCNYKTRVLPVTVNVLIFAVYQFDFFKAERKAQKRVTVKLTCMTIYRLLFFETV